MIKISPLGKRNNRLFIHWELFAGLLLFTSAATAQDWIRVDSLNKSPFTWTQKDREFGFAHFDQIFRANKVNVGHKVHKLSQGSPIEAFEKNGSKEDYVNAFIAEEKVAGLLILQHGKIRLERYALDFTENDRWTSQSVAKSITGILVGAAIKDGYIKSVDDTVTRYIPELKGSAYQHVTIRNLLTMTSGVRWSEVYTDANSDIVKFYTDPVEPGIDETVSYMRRLPKEAEPGKKWVYKTGETHLLGVVVRSATGKSLSEYLSSKIWIPYGMEAKATWNIGRTQQEFAGCCLQMKLRDFARFGQFILDGGVIDGRSILPDGWLHTATHPQISLWPGWGYGYQWWTLGDGTFRALGIHGQMIHIDKARNLVVVITSAWPEAESMRRQLTVNKFLRSVNTEIDR